jgi:hypothetical protein
VRYLTAVAAIDAANADDPTTITVRGATEPLALAHGRLAAEWIDRLAPAADDALRLAARAHHLRRWELPRASHPDGRAGYLRWRRDQKTRHARDVEAILVAAGYDAATVTRVQSLIRRDGLAAGDPGAQAVEDAACLVFVETQLASVAERIDHAHLVEILRKSICKLSPAGVAALADVPVGPAERALLTEALGPPRG